MKEQNMKQCTGLSRIKRNLVERERRNNLKNLYAKLFSQIATEKAKLSVADLLDKATIYAKQLQEKIEVLREKKELLLKGDDDDHEDFEPVLNINSMESTLEVTIVSGLKKNFFLHQVISVLEEEGAQVVSSTYSNAGDRVTYTILSQAIISRIGIDSSRVAERLKKLIS